MYTILTFKTLIQDLELYSNILDPYQFQLISALR